MNVLMIGYDLNRPGQKYEELIEYLKSQGTWWHQLDSTWLVKTPLTAVEMRNAVKARVDANDEVLVVNVTGDMWATFGMSDKGNAWLQKHMDG
ncbi:hypothetical protein [Nocardia sp. AG03]|uniref:hypothetical protein n=1 Tax=Nocardia sp. AG03 TaxID=3025312 RepID=UPI0024189D25|nr:hypothetical protein [Nocardia sp. AG03]